MEVTGVTSDCDVTIREATLNDLSTIVRHRRGMFFDMGHTDDKALNAMEATSSPFIENGLKDGSYRAWLAETDGMVVASGGLVIVGYPSAPHDPRPQRAWILNIYTEPQHRYHGYAKAIVEAIVAWCRSQNYAWVSLHASKAGRHLYETLGFLPTSEMRLVLK
jgi:GNAT superfamily N-acetyltransferase